MPYRSSTPLPAIHEIPSEYNSSPRKELVYEIALRAAVYSDWLKELQGAHRLVQALLQGQLLGQYELFDFLIWPEGLFTRVSLKGASSLSEFLKFLKEKSTPLGATSQSFWDDELRWIRLVSPENLTESTRLFLQKTDQIRRDVNQSNGSSPNLFFFYRDLRLSR